MKNRSNVRKTHEPDSDNQAEHDPILTPSTSDTDVYYITILHEDDTSTYYTCKLEAKKDAREERRLKWLLNAARVNQDYQPTPEDDSAATEYLHLRKARRPIIIG